MSTNEVTKVIIGEEKFTYLQSNSWTNTFK